MTYIQELAEGCGDRYFASDMIKAMKESPFVRVAGTASPERIAEVQEIYGTEFHTQVMGALPPELANAIKQTEIPASEKQIESIELANSSTNEYIRSLGLESQDLPIQNFHLLPRPVYRALSKGIPSEAHSNALFQGVFLDNDAFRDAPLSFYASMALREMVRLKGPSLIWASEKGAEGKYGGLSQRRWGLRVPNARGGEGVDRMEGLEEAVITDIQKELFGKMFTNRLFKKEQDETSGQAEKGYKASLAQKAGIPLDEIYRAVRDGSLLRSWRFPYYQPRVVLSYLINEIHKTHPDQFRELPEVRKKFHTARFTLDLVEVGRLINDTFGEKGLRTVAAMKSGLDPNPSAIKTLETLKSLRA